MQSAACHYKKDLLFKKKRAIVNFVNIFDDISDDFAREIFPLTTLLSDYLYCCASKFFHEWTSQSYIIFEKR